VISYVTWHKNITLMILLKYIYIYIHNIRSIAEKERRRCEDNRGEKITVMQQRCDTIRYDTVLNVQ